MAFNPNDHMMKLKGRDYLQVMWRLVWFREEHADWSIQTACLEHDADHAIFAATIADENGRELATGHGSESKKDFADFLEKAETKAVGRALAMLGYGTQFAPEDMDEGERIVDSPVDRSGAVDMTVKCDRCGQEIVDTTSKDGSLMKAQEVVKIAKLRFKGCYCVDCMKALDATRKKNG